MGRSMSMGYWNDYSSIIHSWELKMKQFFTVVGACILALLISALVVNTIILKFELMRAAIQYLERH